MTKRLFAAPALHFVAIGAFLYFAQGVWAPAPDPPVDDTRLSIVVNQPTLEELRDDFRKTSGRDATGGEERAMIRDYADQEILYREALSRGLDKADRSVKWRLVQKMHFLEDREDGDPDALYREALELGLDRDDIIIRRLLIEKMRLLIKLGAVTEPPDERVLLDFYTERAEDYRQPARVSLRHVFLSSDKRGENVGEDAATLLEKLRGESADAKAAIAMGDVFPLGHEFRSSSEQNLAKLLGPDFAKAAIGLTPGSWHGPIRSAYGLHLVWVDEAHDSALPGLEPVRNQVVQRYLAELREAELNKAMQKLRDRYAVVVESPADTEG